MALDIYLKEGEGERERSVSPYEIWKHFIWGEEERSYLSSADSLPKCLWQLEPGQAQIRSLKLNNDPPMWVVGPRCFPGWALAGSGISRAGTQMGCKHPKQQLTHHAKLMLSLWCSIQAISEPTRATLWVKALPWLWCSDLTGTTTGAFLVSSALPPQPTTTHTHPCFSFWQEHENRITRLPVDFCYIDCNF